MSPTSNAYAKSIRSPIRLVLSLGWLLLIDAVGAQTAEDYFHLGAQNYIAENLEKAKTEVAKGLSLAPEHPQLKALEALLNQQQEQQQQQSQDNQDQNEDQQQENQDQPQQDQQSQSEEQQQQQQEQSSSQDQQDGQKGQEQEDQQGSQGEEAKNDSQQPEEQAGEQGQDSEENRTPPGQTNDMRMLQMSPEEARRLLDSIKGEEKTLIFLPTQLQTNRSNRSRPLKNW